MKTKLLIVALTMFFVTGCDTGGPDPHLGDGIIKYTVLLSAGCSGQVRTVEVIFDDRKVGELVPGNSVSVETSFGEHTLEGLGDNGTRWLRSAVVIEFDGQTYTFTCT